MVPSFSFIPEGFTFWGRNYTNQNTKPSKIGSNTPTHFVLALPQRYGVVIPSKY